MRFSSVRRHFSRLCDRLPPPLVFSDNVIEPASDATSYEESSPNTRISEIVPVTESGVVVVSPEENGSLDKVPGSQSPLDEENGSQSPENITDTQLSTVLEIYEPQDPVKDIFILIDDVYPISITSETALPQGAHLEVSEVALDTAKELLGGEDKGEILFAYDIKIMVPDGESFS